MPQPRCAPDTFVLLPPPTTLTRAGRSLPNDAAHRSQACQRHWTEGGILRKVESGAGRRSRGKRGEATDPAAANAVHKPVRNLPSTIVYSHTGAINSAAHNSLLGGGGGYGGDDGVASVPGGVATGAEKSGAMCATTSSDSDRVGAATAAAWPPPQRRPVGLGPRRSKSVPEFSGKQLSWPHDAAAEALPPWQDDVVRPLRSGRSRQRRARLR
jgi:hypothetical protein